jgi:sialidase-1
VNSGGPEHLRLYYSTPRDCAGDPAACAAPARTRGPRMMLLRRRGGMLLLLLLLLLSSCCRAAAAAPPAGAGTVPTRVAFRSTVQQGGRGGYQCYNAPSIVRHTACSGDGGAPVLVAFLEGRKECHDHHVWMDLLSYRSTDGGKSWSAPLKVHGESDGVHNVTVGGPTAVVDRSTGRLLLLMIRNDPRRASFDILLSYSDDCGRSFATPRDISAQVKPPPGSLGAPWGFYATTFRAIQLRSGRLLACCDHSINGQLSPYPIQTNHAHVIYSDTHGDSWQLGGIEGLNSSDECSTAQLSSGTIIMNIRNYIDQSTGRIRDRTSAASAHRIVRGLAESTDEGLSFGPVRFVSALPDPICFSDILRVNASAFGMRSELPGDDLLLLSNPSNHMGRTNLSIHASLDGGKSWRPGNSVVVEDRGLRGSGYAHMVDMQGAGKVGIIYVQNWRIRYQTNGPGAGQQDNHTFALIDYVAPATRVPVRTDDGVTTTSSSGRRGFGRQAPVRSDHERIEALIQGIVLNMTVAEKARELDTTEGINFLTNGAVDQAKSMRWLAGKGIGRVHDVYATDPAVANQLQRAVVNSSRFGIGAILGEECTHGYQKDGHTMFPAPIGSAASFDVVRTGLLCQRCM